MNILVLFILLIGPGYGFTSTNKKFKKGSLPPDTFVIYVCNLYYLYYDSSPVNLVDYPSHPFALCI